MIEYGKMEIIDDSNIVYEYSRKLQLSAFVDKQLLQVYKPLHTSTAQILLDLIYRISKKENLFNLPIRLQVVILSKITIISNNLGAHIILFGLLIV